MPDPTIEELISYFYLCCLLPLLMLGIWIVSVIIIVMKKNYPNLGKVLSTAGISVLITGILLYAASVPMKGDYEYEDNLMMLPGKDLEYRHDLNNVYVIEIDFKAREAVGSVKIYQVHKIDISHDSLPEYDYEYELMEIVAVNSTKGTINYKIPETGDYSVIFESSIHSIEKNNTIDIHIKFFNRSKWFLKLSGGLTTAIGAILITAGILTIKKHISFIDEKMYFENK